MIRASRVSAVFAGVLVLAWVGVAMGEPQRGGPPRPAEKPAAYGCRLLDVATMPNVVRDGDRIDMFLVKYNCPDKTRPVDIEIRNEAAPGVEPELVKVATDLVLEKGEHTVRLGGGGVAHGGRYITVIRADAPGGKKEVARRVDPANCRAWHIAYVEKTWPFVGKEGSFRTDPEPFRPGERIDKFVLTTNLRFPVKSTDIKVSWQPRTGSNPEARRELVKVATDVSLPAGRYTTNLQGGGVGREGYYILEIPSLKLTSYFKTVCNGWTLSR